MSVKESNAQQVTAVRIIDKFILDAIAKEQKCRGDSTPTKTAVRLISERLAQLEMTRGKGPQIEQTFKLVPQEA